MKDLFFYNRDVIFEWPLTENVVLLVECEYDKVVLCCNCTLHAKEKKIQNFGISNSRTYAHTHKGPFNKR